MDYMELERQFDAESFGYIRCTRNNLVASYAEVGPWQVSTMGCEMRMSRPWGFDPGGQIEDLVNEGFSGEVIGVYIIENADTENLTCWVRLKKTSVNGRTMTVAAPLETLIAI